MTTNYPTTLDSYTAVTDGVDNIVAAHHNNHSDAIVAIETELGLDPSNSSGAAPNYTDVASRLTAMQTAITANAAIGCDIYRAATSTANTGTGQRVLTGYDTTRTGSDASFTVNYASGTITVPTTAWYAIDGHVRLSTQITDTLALSVADGTTEYLRSSAMSASTFDIHVSGRAYVTASTALKIFFSSAVSASPVGNTFGSYYNFRVVKC